MKAAQHETFNPPDTNDFKDAWSAVRAIETGTVLPTQFAERLARVVYAAERSRKLLTGIPTCAEARQM